MLKKNSEVPSTHNVQQFMSKLVHCVDQKKGSDIIIFDVRGISPITDYLIIASGLSELHNRTIAEYIMQYERPNHVEGYEMGQWILIDYFDVIVHIFSQEAREFYGLERLWGDAPQLPVDHDTPTP
jgi:ribosome-associated protein